MFQESIRSTQWEIQHQKQHVKQHVKHWFFATMVAGAGKGNFQLPDTACNSVSLYLSLQESMQELTLKIQTEFLALNMCKVRIVPAKAKK